MLHDHICVTLLLNKNNNDHIHPGHLEMEEEVDSMWGLRPPLCLSRLPGRAFLTTTEMKSRHPRSELWSFYTPVFDFDLSSRLHLSSTSTATPQPQPPYPSLSTHQAASRHAARRHTARRHTASRHTASKHTASRHAAAYATARVQNFAASPPAPHCMVPPIMPGQPRQVFDLTGDDDDVAIKNEPTVKTEPSIKTESSGQGGSSPLVPAPNRLEWLFGNFKHALNTMPNYQVYQLWYL